MRRFDPLTLAGVAALLIGGLGIAAAPGAAPFVVGACAILLALALLVTAAFWRALARAGGELTAAMVVSWAGVVPGIALLAGLNQPPDAAAILLPVSLIDLLWHACGPMMFSVSAALSPPGDSPGALNFVRIGHLTAWVGSAAAAAFVG